MLSGTVIKGRARSGGRPLARYLLTQGENEEVGLLYVDGQEKFDEIGFTNLLGDFSLTEKLTRSKKGIYHAIINPPEKTSMHMTNEQWLQSANILAQELGFEQQRMALVLHQKAQRKHLHCIFERYDHDKGIVVPISHNYRKHLKAGQKIGQLLNLKPLPERNPKRNSMKETLTNLWQTTDTASQFIAKAKAAGYMIAKGYDRKPFLVIDESGRSFNMVRHIANAKTADVRERFGKTVLMDERKAVAFVRNQQSIAGEQEKAKPDNRQAFLNNLKKTQSQQQVQKPKIH